jgi:hypothetical protein
MINYNTIINMGAEIPSIDSEPTHCPRCSRQFSCDLYILMDSPLNHEYTETDCQCWLCVDCWTQLAEQETNECPICNNDLAGFLEYCYEDSDSDDEDEENEEESRNCARCNVDFSRDNVIRDNSENNDYTETDCKCWMCVDCWMELAEQEIADCPSCGSHIEGFLQDCYLNNSDDEMSDSDMSSSEREFATDETSCIETSEDEEIIISEDEGDGK